MSKQTSHGETTELKNPGPFVMSHAMRGRLVSFMIIGVLSFLIGLEREPTRAWASFIHNHFYFMSLAVGGLFFAAIQWITNAMWSAPVRRLSEAFTAYLPAVLVGMLILFFGIHHLYRWSHLEHVAGDMVLEGKSGYLNVSFFMTRNVIAILLWFFFAKKMVGNSLKQDSTRNANLTLNNRFLSPIFLILFGLTFTMVSFDLLMSLDPHWFSTMFGVYCFAGMFYSNLAATCLLTLYLKSKDKLEGFVNENHLHDLGKFMFAFTIFWAYIGFSQFMLIWYANLPEETGYFIHRFHGRWAYVSVFLLVGKFFLPFFFMLPRAAKRSPKMLWAMGWWMLIAQWIDVLWMVQPEFSPEGPVFGWTEVGITLGFVGLFGLLVFRFLGKHSIVAIGDPRLPEAVFQHQQ